MVMLQRLKLSTKILALGILITALYLGLLGWIYPRFQSKMYENKNEMIENLVTSSVDMVDHYAALAKDGKMTEEEAKEQAKEALRTMRYGDNDYFFVVNTDVVTEMHPIDPKLEGQSMTDTKDPNGKALFVEMVNVAKNKGSGSVDYMWPKIRIFQACAQDFIREAAARVGLGRRHRHLRG